MKKYICFLSLWQKWLFQACNLFLEWFNMVNYLRQFRYKLVVLSVLAFLISGVVNSKPNAIYNYYFHDLFLMNPAAAGYNKLCHDFKAFHQMQWLGTEGSPTTQVFSYQGPLSGNLGTGTYVYNDKNAQQKEFGLHQAFSYEVFFIKEKTRNFSMTLGLGGSFNQHSVDESNLIGVDINDPAMAGGIESGWGYNLSSGALFKYNFLSAGIAITNMLPQNNPLYDNINEPGLPLVVQYTFGAHFKHPNRELYWEPSIMFRESGRYDNRFDVNIKGMIPSPTNDYLWFWGAMNYRRTVDYDFGKSRAIALTLGVALKRLSAGVEYQYGLTNAQAQFGSAYQIVLGYKICKRAYGGIPCSEKDYIMSAGDNNKYKSKRRR